METKTEKLEYVVLKDDSEPLKIFDNLSDAKDYRSELIEIGYDYVTIEEIIPSKNINFTDEDKLRLSQLMWWGGRDNFFETFCEEMDIKIDTNSEIFCDIEEYVLEKIKEMQSNINEYNEKKLEILRWECEDE